jgi:uncharacterized protein (DUF433 family)
MSTRQHRSFRFDPSTLERLEQRSRETGLTQTALVERYVDEGLRRDRHSDIVFVDEPAGRRARLAGTGLDVWEIVETVQDNGGSTREASLYLGVPERHVIAGMSYYADFRYEIDAWIRSNAQLFEQDEARMRRIADALA